MKRPSMRYRRSLVKRPALAPRRPGRLLRLLGSGFAPSCACFCCWFWPAAGPAPGPSSCACAACRRERLPRRLRRRQVVGQRVRDLLDRAQPLAGRVDQLRSRAACSPRPRRAAPRRPRAAGSSAALTSFAAFSSCRWPREFASAPSSRFASGNSALARRSCTLRVARASRHVQRARICSGASALPSPSARSSDRGRPAARSLLPGRRLGHERDEVVEARRGRPSSRRGRRARSAAGAGSGSRPRRRSGTARARRGSALPSVNFFTNSTRSSKRTLRPAIVAQ